MLNMSHPLQNLPYVNAKINVRSLKYKPSTLRFDFDKLGIFHAKQTAVGIEGLKTYYSRAKSLWKLLIYTLEIYFRNARLRY